MHYWRKETDLKETENNNNKQTTTNNQQTQTKQFDLLHQVKGKITQKTQKHVLKKFSKSSSLNCNLFMQYALSYQNYIATNTFKLRNLSEKQIQMAIKYFFEILLK